MPIYEYRCQACGHELEALQSFSDAPLRACPRCSKDALFKLVSVAGFQLKGSGWYATDFRNSGKKPAGKDAPKADVKADGGEAKSDTGSTTAAKSETKSTSDAPAVTAGTTPASS
jgi:putative FmdB family regulatory protein